jgi:hypothetical protein
MDEKVLADARAAFPAEKAAITLGAAIHSPPGRMIAGRDTTLVPRGITVALPGRPPRRRRY